MSRLPPQVYGADFETVVSTERTRVWLWGLESFTSGVFEYGTDIDSFMGRLSQLSCTVYFHNLKFDIQFILYWLLTNGYRHVTTKFPDKGCFTTLISDMGIFYSAEVKFESGARVKFLDSYKLIPLPIQKIPKAFNLSIQKLDLDYEEIRELDHVPTDDEINYIKNDVEILIGGVKAMHDNGLSKMTAASNALNNFKSIMTKKDYDVKFPPLTLSEDRDMRMSYKGGWSYVNKQYQGKMIGKGQVYDVNSMYPWAMRECVLPYGPPVFYRGKYKEDKTYPLYIQSLTCRFKLKKGKYPSIQLKGNMRFGDTEYIEEAVEETEILTLTSVDLGLFFECYDVWDITWNCGYKMRGCRGMFDDYIDYWYNVKNEAKRTNNDALYYIAKLMLNSLYGKFGSNPLKRSKYPWYDKDNDIVRYSLMSEEESTGGYVPIASFITSYARKRIIEAANACGERFVYADTDSIHIVGTEIPEIDIDDFKLGCFKLESEFTRAKFMRAKCYIEEINGELNKKCAGLPKKSKELFDFSTMITGAEFGGKLVPVNVPGGVVLVDRKFTIK